MRPASRALRAFLYPSLAIVLAGLALAGCIRSESGIERFGDGRPKSRFSFLRDGNGDTVRHGIRTTWYPDGGKESMETYVNGLLQGYVLRWYPDGALKSVEHFADGEPDGRAKFWDADGNLSACYDSRKGDCLRSDGNEGISTGRMAGAP